MTQEDLELEVTQVCNNNLFCTPTGQHYEYYLSGEIGHCSEYIDLLQLLRTCNSEDIITMYINSEGGNLDTTLQIVTAMNHSNAYIITQIDANCYSGASMIFLAGSEFHVGPFATFMAHNYSGGAYGKGNELISRIEFEKKTIDKFYRIIYDKIFSEEELDGISRGDDIYLDSDELIERLNNAYGKETVNPNVNPDLKSDDDVEE